MGQAVGLVERLDQRVALYLKEIIRNGCRRVKKLQSRVSEFVQEKYFMEKDHQNLSGEGLILIGRKYAISSLGSNLKCVIPKLIKKMLQNKEKNGQDGTKSSFHGGMLVLCAQRFVLEMIEAMECFFISYIVYHPMFSIIFKVKVVLIASR